MSVLEAAFSKIRKHTLDLLLRIKLMSCVNDCALRSGRESGHMRKKCGGLT
jgi:hypothetical protein